MIGSEIGQHFKNNAGKQTKEFWSTREFQERYQQRSWDRFSELLKIVNTRLFLHFPKNERYTCF